ncbi:MAG: EAL domain-containing protein [Proteobacteria bacterium]|nr:EAL domain-containing protein [Pseudomonadota bacterium]
MRRWTVLSLVGFTLLSVFLLAVAWEFVFKDLIGPLLADDYGEESFQERWEYVITTTVFAAFALIIPAVLSTRLATEVNATSGRIKALNARLETRVVERTWDLLGEIAERKQAEKTLRDSEARMRDLVEYTSDWVWEMDADLRFSYFSRRFLEVAGIRPEVLLGKTRRELGRGDVDDEKWHRHLADLEARRPFRDFRYKFVHRDGRTLHFLVNGKPVFDKAGNFRGYRGVGSDITARANAEEQARSAQERLAIAIDGLSEHFVLFDSEDRIVLTNAAWRELNQKIGDMTAPGVRFEDHLRAAVKAGLLPEAVGREEKWLRWRMDLHRNPKGPFEVERQDGRWILVNEQRLPDGSAILIISDITERKQAEKALRESEGRFRTLIDKSSQGILVHRNHDMLYANQTLVEMFGYDSADEVLALESGDALTAPEERDRLLRYHQARLRGEPAPVDYEYKGLRKDGSHLWLENRSFWIEWEGGPAICTTLFDITERKRADAALRESEERFRAVVDNSPTKIHIKDLDGRYTLINRQSEILFGVTNEEARGKTSRDIFPKEVADSFAGHDQAVIESGQTIENEEEWVCDDGVHTYLTVKFPILGATGEIVAVGAIGTDITERKRAEEAQRRSEERLRGAVESLQEGFGLFDADDRLVLINDEYRRINPSAQEILDRGLRYEDLLRANVKRGMIVEAVGREEEFIRERVQQHRNPKDPILRQFANGVWYLIKETRTPEGGTAITFIDITKQKQVEEQIRRQANYDSLTGLPNRMLFLDRLKQAIVSVRRNNGLLALLFIDLDRFKVVNDTLGHVVGDRLLQEAAERLQASVREVDTVARLGGDEFTIILQDIAKAEDAAMVANKVIDNLGKPFLLDGHEAFIGASIGITIFPADGDNATTLLRNADVAMYRAKDAGRNEHQFFTKAMDAQALNRMSLENDLRYALERKQLFVHYQPIVEFQSERVINAEALLRWRHPTRGLVAPDEFIPLAEETGLIKSLGEWVLRTACAQAQAWRDMDLPVFGVSVNLSSGQLKRGFSRDTVATVLEETGLSPELLTFEITESLIMEDAEEAIAYLHAIREMGVGLSIDDFGTGYSSLSYLKRLPVDSVKIDRSFIHDVTVDPEDASLADAIIALAHNLGLKVIAEGVETKEQLDFLISRGCDLYQGYYFAKPMTAKKFQKRMRTGQWSHPAKKKASSVRAAKRRKPATGDPRRASRGAGIR